MTELNHNLPTIGNYCFVLDIDGHMLKVIYKYSPFANSLNSSYYKQSDIGKDYHFVHFELIGKTASETGYKSYFTRLSCIDDNPYDFAKRLAEYLYDELKKSHPKLFTPQLELF